MKTIPQGFQVLAIAHLNPRAIAIRLGFRLERGLVGHGAPCPYRGGLV